ncbi:hypothetical protein SAMN05216243_3122 [Sediminibacillus albus]|uniref:Uncharacterized protein n=1 Tax=Sediminibacillus albus TaxID=407036 RepID=A0A1G9BU59_9BACI|nr:hypothetical protein SAMN05216243_3122 [Sediminibacillus albus]
MRFLGEAEAYAPLFCMLGTMQLLFVFPKIGQFSPSGRMDGQTTIILAQD